MQGLGLMVYCHSMLDTVHFQFGHKNLEHAKHTVGAQDSCELFLLYNFFEAQLRLEGFIKVIQVKVCHHN